MLKKYAALTICLFGYLSLVFIYIVVRTFTTPIMYDEVMNFQLYVERAAFQPMHCIPDANNHLVSTTLNYIMYLLVGKNLLLFRIPETLSFLLLAYYLLRFRIFFSSKIAFAAFVILMSSSSYIISFYSLARGYGLAVSFLMACIFHFLRYYKNPTYKDLIITMVYVFLAVWSNLAMLFALGTLLGLTQLKVLSPKSEIKMKDRLISTGIIMVLGITPLLFAVQWSFELQHSGALYIGYAGNPFFVYFIALPTDLFVSDYWGGVLSIIWSLITICSVSIYLLKYRASRNLLLSGLIFAGAIGGTVLANILFNVNYPSGRAAAHIIILFGIPFCLLMDQLKAKWNYLALFPGLYFMIHLIWTANFHYSTIWKYETITEELAYQIEDLQKESNELLTISVTPSFAKTLGYYNWKHQAGLNFFQDMDYPSKVADLLVTFHYMRKIDLSDYDTIYYDPLVDVGLLQRKNKLKWVEIYDTLISTMSSEEGYILFADMTLNTSGNKAYKAAITAQLQTNKPPNNNLLIFTTESKLGECGSYNFGLLGNSIPVDQKPFEFNRSLFVSKLNCNSTRFQFYLLNENHSNWQIKNARIRFLETASPL